MIPPCDPAILNSNPQFKKLYTHLTSDLLNPDGSTRANDVQQRAKESAEVRDSNPSDLQGASYAYAMYFLKELKNYQKRNARNEIKKRAVEWIAFDPDTELPEEVSERANDRSFFLSTMILCMDIYIHIFCLHTTMMERFCHGFESCPYT